MKISKETYAILKNFTAINNSVWVNGDQPGVLKTVSIAENIIGIYETEETFPEWRFYNSVPFMSMINLLDLSKVDFDFQEMAVTIKCPGTRAVIVYDAIELIPKLGNLKEAASYKKFDNFDAKFTLDSNRVSQVQKAANILGTPDMSVMLKDGKGIITLADQENPDSSFMKVAISGEGSCDITMMVKNLQIVDGDYTIHVASSTLSRFDHDKLPLFYIVAAKKD